MQTRTKLLLAFSHCCVVVLAYGAFLFSIKGESAMKKNHNKKNYRVALLLSENVFYHQRAAEGFMQALHTNQALGDTCDVKRYYARGLEPLLVSQVVHKAFDDKPDIIIPIGGTMSQFAASTSRNIDSQIPIVFIGVSQPVEMGLVQDEKRSGNNITGVGTGVEKNMLPLRLLQAIKPQLRSILLPYHAYSAGGTSELMAAQIKRYFGPRGVSVTLLPVEVVGDVIMRIRPLLVEHDTMMYLEGDLVGEAHVGLIKLCSRYGVTLFALDLEAVSQGAALAYGVEPRLTGREAVRHVEQILVQGTHPSDIPVTLLQDVRRLVINRENAYKQGLRISPLISELLTRASFYTGEQP